MRKTAHAPKESPIRVKKLALIGAGKLGEGLLSGILSSQSVPVGRAVATVAHQPRADYLAEKYGLKALTDNPQAVSGADLVLICLKPQQVKGFLHEVKRELSKDALIISAAASVTTSLIERISRNRLRPRTFSSIHSRANTPLWTSAKIFFMVSRTRALMTTGPRV